MRLTRKPAPAAPPEDPKRELAWQIAQDVYDLRTQQNLSQAELAERVGTKQPRISVLESAAGAPPTLTLLLRVATALGARLVVRLEKRNSE